MGTMRPLIILNPAAGSAAQAPKLREAVGDSADIALCEGPGAARRLAADAVRKGRELVIAAGGDGTVHEVVQGLAVDFRRTRLGLIPFGTGNDLARTLGIPIDPIEALKMLEGSAERVIDLVRAESGNDSAYCVNVAAGGFSGQVDEVLTDELKATWGPLSYVRGALEVLPNLTEYKTTLAYDDGSWEAVPAFNVIVANGRTCAGGIRVAPDADPADGLIDVVVVRYGSMLDLAAVGASLLAGDYQTSSEVSHRRARRVRIASKPGMWFNVDGELFTKEPVTFSIEPGVLRIAGVSP